MIATSLKRHPGQGPGILDDGLRDTLPFELSRLTNLTRFCCNQLLKTKVSIIEVIMSTTMEDIYRSCTAVKIEGRGQIFDRKVMSKVRLTNSP